MTPIDQATRDLATGAVEQSMALSAGAGSGKTSVLTERLVNVLASGVAPSRVAAITFTEKAAGELQRRVRDALEARLHEAPGDATLRRQLERFHELTLSTIHSFCRGLLATEPLASRWTPGTEIAERDGRGLSLGLSRWRRHLAAGDPLLLGLFDLLLAPRSLLEGVRELIGHRDLTPRLAAAGMDWDAAHAELRAVHGAVEAAAAVCGAPRTDKLLSNNVELRARLASWASQPAGEATLDALVSDARVKRTGGTKKDWGPDGKEAFIAAGEGFDAWKAAWLARAHRDLVASLHGLVVPAVIDARTSDAVATFEDLLFRAAELLRQPAVRARLAERYDALLIDEVQDTDPIQAECAVLLARDPAADGPWLVTPPIPGRLFAVGDPKQSIYRFRRADVTVWSDLEQLIAADGHKASLVQNFRSVPGLVDWVTHVFADMADFEAQEAARGPAALDPVVLVDSDVDHQIEHALSHLWALKAGGAQVVDRESRALRPLRWGDVMILLPRWASADAIAERFGAAGIEAVVEGGAAFFKGEEVRLGLSALRALDEPGDAEAVVHALRGLFGLTFEDLARHVAAGGSFRTTIPDQPGGPVRDALELLRDLRAARVDSWVPVLDRLLEETRASAVWALLADGASRLANLDKLRAMIRELELTARSPSAVVNELVAMAGQDGEEDLSRADADADAVRITSFFKAKGLEAPVVVLLDLSRAKPTPSVVPHRAEQQVSLKVGASFAPPDWDAAYAAEVAAFNEERRRWMYVACTRARDQLVLVRHEKANLLDLVAGGFDPEGISDGAVQALAPGVTVRVRVGAALPPAPRTTETFPGRDAAADALLAAPARL
ncbi:MAG: hypothetical protein EP329_00155, partial [Deltaproteobacteria bacterium]